MPIRQSNSKLHAFADRQMVRLVADTRVGTEISALREQLAELRVIKQQRSVALQDIVTLKTLMPNISVR
jgi:hypothetical protein